MAISQSENIERRSAPHDQGYAGEAVSVADGLSVELTPAPFTRRFFAYAIDLGIVNGILYLLFILVTILAIAVGVPLLALMPKMNESKTIVIVIWMSIFFLIFLFVLSLYHGYFIYYENRDGTTPGKRLFGLKVISTTGPRLTLSQCVLRDFMRYIDAMMVFPGLIAMAATAHSRRLGDIMAGTLVVYSAHKEQSLEAMYLPASDFQLLSHRLEPITIDPKLAKSYLRYAYPRYIRKSSPANPDQENEWYGQALKHFRTPSDGSIDTETVLRFFAELCFKTSNKR